MNETDLIIYNKLCKILISTDYKVQFIPNQRDTMTLYRFGWFIIDGYKYSISALSYRSEIITFETNDNFKVKFSLKTKTVVKNNFKKDTKFTTIIKKSKRLLSNILKDLSDKLRD